MKLFWRDKAKSQNGRSGSDPDWFMDGLKGELWLADMTWLGVDVGLEDNSSEAPVPVQEDSSITGKINLDS